MNRPLSLLNSGGSSYSLANECLRLFGDSRNDSFVIDLALLSMRLSAGHAFSMRIRYRATGRTCGFPQPLKLSMNSAIRRRHLKVWWRSCPPYRKNGAREPKVLGQYLASIFVPIATIQIETLWEGAPLFRKYACDAFARVSVAVGV